MKDIKKQLLNEMNSRVPKLNDELKNYPITTSVNKSRMPRFSFYLGGLLACLLVLAVVLPFAFKKEPKTNSCYLFEVNPSVLVYTDDTGEVTKIKSGYEDADELLLGINYEELIGENIEDVSISLVDNLIQLGYFDANSYENIMKISTDDSDSTISSVISNYTSKCGYFVAVFEDELTVEDVNEVLKTNISNLNQVEEALDSLEDLIVDNITEEENYVEKYQEQYLNEYLSNVIFADLEKLEKIEKTLIKLNETYDAISELSFLKDYWIIKSFYASNPDSINSDLKELIKEMEELLNEYFDISGSNILSGPELKIAYAYVTTLPMEEIRKLAETLDNDELTKNLEALINFVKLVDEDAASNLEKYCKIPEGIEEYKSKVKEVQTSNYNSRKKKYEAEYKRVKESINVDQFKEYLDALIEKYGSLENFWKNK